MLFFALILIGLVLLTGYFNKKRSDSDLKIKEVLTSQKNLKSNFLLVSESINKLKSENNLSSEKINKILDKLKALE
jgi:regulatory protein YycI of two-component signal transduction system YycFG